MRFTRTAIPLLLLAAMTVTGAQAKKTSITLTEDTFANDVQLSRGTYQIEVVPGGDSITFTHGRKTIATVPCKVEPLGIALQGDAIVQRARPDGAPQILRILLASQGWTINLAPSTPVTSARK